MEVEAINESIIKRSCYPKPPRRMANLKRMPTHDNLLTGDYLSVESPSYDEDDVLAGLPIDDDLEDDVFEDKKDIRELLPEIEVIIETDENDEELEQIELNKNQLGNDILYARMSQRCLSPPAYVRSFITNSEQYQIESFYKSLKSKVYVCSCTASLYISCVMPLKEWQFENYGVPVIVVEKQGTNTNRLWLVLAELGTGIPLWRDRLDYMSGYSRCERVNFHHLSVSWSHRLKAGLSFDCEGSASSFWLRICQLTSRLENLGVSLPKHHSKNKRPKVPKKKLPSKTEISSPCCFKHITSVQVQDKRRFKSLQNLVSTGIDQSRPSTSRM